MWVLESPLSAFGLDRHLMPALNQIVCALQFLYGVTLSEALIPEGISHAREPQRAAGRAQC